MEKELGKITKVEMGFSDHGILGVMFDLDFGGTAQSVFLQLSVYNPQNKKQFGREVGVTTLIRVMEAFRVTRLQEIAGRTVYALRETKNGPIHGFELPKFDGGAVVALV